MGTRIPSVPFSTPTIESLEERARLAKRPPVGRVAGLPSTLGSKSARFFGPLFRPEARGFFVVGAVVVGAIAMFTLGASASAALRRERRHKLWIPL